MNYNIVASGKRIRELRLQKGLTQEQLADQLGYSRTHITLVEVGEKGCSADMVVALAEVFDVSTDYILLGKMSNSNNATILQDRFSHLMSQMQDFQKLL